MLLSYTHTLAIMLSYTYTYIYILCVLLCVFEIFRPRSREIKLAILDLSHFMDYMGRGTLFVKESLMAAAANAVGAFARALLITERTFVSIVEEPTEDEAARLAGEEKEAQSAAGAGAGHGHGLGMVTSSSMSLRSGLGDDSTSMGLQACMQLLIELNNSLLLPHGAQGVLQYAKTTDALQGGVPAKWNELLGDWDTALKV